MDAFKRLRRIFPGANVETKLVILSPSTRLRLGRERIELAPYEIEDDGTYIYAAFVPERNTIFVRLADAQ